MKEPRHVKHFQRILSAVIMIAIMLCSGIFGVVPANAASVSVNDAKASVEKQYGVKLDIGKISGFSDKEQVSDIKRIGEYLAFIPSELHNAMLSHFKSKGKSITIKIAPRPDGVADGVYTHDNVTITMYTVGYGFNFTGAMTGHIFAHEYGHMLHAVLNEKYGATKFTNEWTALNGGLKYNTYDYDNPLYTKTFIRDYAAQSLSEDVADTFGYFAGYQQLIRINYSDLYDTSIWKKAMLLESIAKSTLKVERIYLPYYIPQTPASWAADAVKRGFGTQEDWRGIFGGADGKLYHEPISRAEFCEFLMETLNSVCMERYGRSVISDVRGTLTLDPSDSESYCTVMNLKNGKATLDFKIPRPFTDFYSDNVSFAHYFNIVSGTNTTEFDPNGKLTREQAAVFMEKACAVLGIADKGGVSPVPTDASSISAWAKSGVEFVMRNGIMSGTGGGEFSPKQTYSYEQAYITLIKLYDIAIAVPTVYNSAEFTIGYPGATGGGLTRNMTNLGRRSITVGGSFYFTITDGLSEERLSKITWTISNPAVAVIADIWEGGKTAYIEILSKGTVKITASDGTYSSSLTFTVGE